MICDVNVIVEPLVINVQVTGATGVDGRVQTIVAGANVTVDNTDPRNPVISSTGGGGSETAAQIRDKLETLTTPNRLDITAIENAPTQYTDAMAQEANAAALSGKASITDVANAISTANAYTDSKPHWETISTVICDNTSSSMFFTGLTAGNKYRLRFVSVDATGNQALGFRLRSGGSTGTLLTSHYSGSLTQSTNANVISIRGSGLTSIPLNGSLQPRNLSTLNQTLNIKVDSSFNKCFISYDANNYTLDGSIVNIITFVGTAIPLVSSFDTIEIYATGVVTFVNGSIILERWVE